MKTEIIIPTFGQEDFTCACFESIARHTKDYRLVWLDNGSDASSRNVVMPSFKKNRGRMSLWLGENKGFVGGVNLALKVLFDVWGTKSEYIVIQNNDTVVGPGWLVKMISVMENDAKIGAVGPVSAWRGDGMQCWNNVLPVAYHGQYQGMSVDERAQTIWGVNRHKHVKVPVVTFFCTVFRREVFDKIGMLDPDYGFGLYDDHDFCARLKSAGYACAVATGVYVLHHHRTTFKSMMSDAEIERAKEENRRLFLSKRAKGGQGG